MERIFKEGLGPQGKKPAITNTAKAKTAKTERPMILPKGPSSPLHPLWLTS